MWAVTPSPPPSSPSMHQLSVFAGLMCRYEPAAADMVPVPVPAAAAATEGRKKALSGLIVVIVVATDKCLCVNGFPDSPVCISVSQLRCGDFLTLIVPLCSVCTLLGTRGCWVKKTKKQKKKHVVQCYGEQGTQGTVWRKWCKGGWRITLQKASWSWISPWILEIWTSGVERVVFTEEVWLLPVFGWMVVSQV